MSGVGKMKSIAGLSLKTFLITVIGILLLGIYVGILLFGENSLTALTQLEAKKTMLEQDEKRLKRENQTLQKELFELKQLEPREQ